MFSPKYHFGTIAAIFFALGIGFLIGGTLGQQWVMQTETQLVEKLLTKYEEKAEENVLLQKRLVSLQMLHQAINPSFQNKTILWIRPENEKNALLSFAVESLGAKWEEIPPYAADIEDITNHLSGPDLIIVSDSNLAEHIGKNAYFSEDAPGATGPKVVVFEEKSKLGEDAKSTVDLILFLKKVLEEDSYASVGFYRYSGME